MKNNITKLIYFLLSFNFFLITSVKAETALYDLEGSKINYQNNNNLIIAEGNAKAVDNLGRKIFADKIIYNKEKLLITTESKSIYKDENGNTLIANNFSYDIGKKIISANKNASFIDKLGNIFNFDQLKFYQETEKGYGNNLNAKLIDKSSVEAKIAEFDNKAGILRVGKKKTNSFLDPLINLFKNYSNSYTPCEDNNQMKKNINDRCPDWRIDTQETVHDYNNKMVYHYGSIIKIKNIPVFYTPYFSHPDPSVKQKSGILPPSVKNFTNLGQTLKVPYYLVIDKKRDLTFTPIYYFDENPIFLTEFRQQNKNSKFYIDSSYSKGYKNLNKKDENGNLIERTDGSRNHFFFNFLGSYNDLLFSKNDIEVNVQRISQKNYLNVNQINTQYIKQDIFSLNNNFILNSYEKNKKIKIQANIYENLNIEDKNTKYQYTLPSLEFSDYFNKNGHYVNLNSTFSNLNTGGDSQQVYNTNKIETISKTTILPFLDGLTNTFKATLNNLNFYNQNINNEKENLNNLIYLTAALENSYPLIKLSENNNREEIISPKIFSKVITGSSTNANNQNNITSYDQVFLMDRMNSITNPERGVTLGYGIEYDNSFKNEEKVIVTKKKMTFGQVIKPNYLNKNENRNSLSDTTSNFVGKLETYNQSDFNKNYSKISYEYALSNDLSKVLKNSINADLGISDNILTANYYETHDIGNEHYIDLKFTKKIENELNFIIGGRKNIQENFTENNFIETNYESDCLKISLNLTKTFYQNSDVRPSNNLNFTVVFKPFGTPVSPDLSSFVK